tara:strand:- start:2556 stop:3098 length:543 start_codon:yes stop_codon:yes gene_type:complete
MDKRTQQDIEKFIRTISKSVKKEEYKDILEEASRATIDSIKVRVPIAKKPVKRYISKSSKRLSKRGKGKAKPVAVYYPGNLRRSIKILKHLNKSNRAMTWKFRRVYFGVNLHKGKSDGNFKGDRTDAYYAHMIEYGTARGIEGVGYFRKGLNSGAPKTLARLKRLVQKRIQQNLRRNGIR